MYGVLGAEVCYFGVEIREDGKDRDGEKVGWEDEFARGCFGVEQRFWRVEG